ncbi:MAG TPA: hypothetical protein VMF69_01830 [Gemmataceae bacterium]|nr:hypothetical protein [Gemmataceae bacterium]
MVTCVQRAGTGVIAELLGVIAVGVAGEDLVNGLGEQGFGGVFDVFGGAGIGESLSEVGDDTHRCQSASDHVADGHVTV